MGARKQSPETFSFYPFENLKEKIDSTKISVGSKPAVKKDDEQPSDEELFAAAMKEVNEIKEYRQIKVHPKRTVPLISHKQHSTDELRILERVTRGLMPINLPDTQEYVEWVNPSYRHTSHGNIASKLHKGFFSVQDCLDLHGLFVGEAEAAIERFFKESLEKGLRCIKIIHGRGLRSQNGPVLKNALIDLLTYRCRKHVIAFTSARQCDGGLGALYVLLK